MHIILHSRVNDWTERVSMEDAAARIDTLAGRSGIGAYAVAQAHAYRRRGRRESCFVRCRIGSPGHELSGGLCFVVEAVS